MVHALTEHRRDGAVTTADLPAWIFADAADDESPTAPANAAAPATRTPPPTRDEFLAAHQQLAGSVTALARHFGRDRRQIYRWLDAYGLRG